MLRNENYDKQLFIGLIITVVLLASFSLLFFNETVRAEEAAELLKEENLVHGAELYSTNCVACHGVNGEGIVGPALNNKALLEAAGDNVLFATIQIGRPNTKMPAWGQAYGGALTDQEIYNLVSFIRAYEENAPDIEETQASESGSEEILTGEELAQRAFKKGGCAACHTIPGVEGAVGALGPNLSEIGKVVADRLESGEYTGSASTLGEYFYEALTDPNAFIAPACPSGPCVEGLMQPMTGTLSEEEIKAVAEYLADLQGDN